MGATSSKVLQFPRDPASLPAAELSDAELAEQIILLNSYAARYEALALEACARIDLKSPANKPAYLESNGQAVEITPRAAVRTLRISGRILRQECLFRGLDFFALAKMPAEAARRAFGDDWFERNSFVEYSGPRAVRVVTDGPRAA